MSAIHILKVADGSRLCENDAVIRANIIVPREGVHDEAVHRG